MPLPPPPLDAARPAALAGARARLRAHPLHDAIRSPRALRAFVEHHVVCVLDFMSLLKSLQRDLSCTAVPWVPSADPAATRLIQRIVLDEESDVRADGRVTSHFAWYLEAMDEVGADSGPVRELVEALRGGAALGPALADSRLPPAAVAFGATTAELLEAPLCARASAFFHGREEILPEVFLAIVTRLERSGLRAPALVEYLRRHVAIDDGEHGPMGERLLARLCADGAARAQAERAALVALAARERLWDALAALLSVPG